MWRFGLRRIGGGALLLALLLPWITISANGCGIQRSFTAITMVTAGPGQYINMSGGPLPPNTTAFLILTIIVIAALVAGAAVALLARAQAGWAFALVAAALTGFTMLMRALQATLSGSFGILTMSYDSGYYLAWLCAAALGLGALPSAAPVKATPIEPPAAAYDETAASAEVPTLTCRRCGGRVHATAAFCSGCGLGVENMRNDTPDAGAKTGRDERGSELGLAGSGA